MGVPTHRLLAKTEAGPTRAEVTGPQRASLYAVAAITGLRADELRRTLVSHLVLTGPDLRVDVEAATAKSRKVQNVALTPAQAAFIADLVAGKLPDDPAFKVPVNQARVLRADLEQAGIPYSLLGRDLDFHALRGLGGSWMIAAVADLKTVRERMRHASMATTAKSYVHSVGDSGRRGAAAVPVLTDPEQTRSANQSALMSGSVSVLSGVVQVPNENPSFSTGNQGIREWSQRDTNRTFCQMYAGADLASQTALPSGFFLP